MCLLPVIPNGMIPYISAQTKLSLREFTFALALGCTPSILFYVVCGDFLLSEHFHITAPIVAVILVLALLIFLFRSKIASKIEPLIGKFLGI